MVKKMKNKLILLVTLVSVMLAGCVPGTSVDTIVDRVSETDKPAVETPEPTQAGPKETKLSLKQKGTAGDWDICVRSVAVKKKILDGKYRYFKPNKGKAYAVFTLSVKNKGKKTATFLPRVGMKDTMIQGRLVDEKGNEYNLVQLLGYSKDLVYGSVGASKTKKGIITVEIPKKMSKKVKTMTLQLGTSEEKLVYSLR